MSVEQAFLAGILEHPDDNTPRLVFADWLDEQGQPERAEFIRLQCELAGMSGDEPRYDDLKEREQELLRAHEESWVGSVVRFTRGRRWSRGFLSGVTLAVGDFIRHGEELYRLGPADDISLTEAAMALRGLARCPLLARVRRLGLVHQELTDAALEGLLESPYLGGLRGLLLPSNRLTAHAAAMLRRQLGNSELAELDLGAVRDGCNQIGDEGVHELMAGRWPSLMVLRLGYTGLTREGVGALVRAPLFGQLIHLDLGHNSLGPEAVEEVTGSAVSTRLTNLNLRVNPIGDRGAEALAGWPGLAGVRQFDLSFCNIGRRGLGALGRSPLLSGLRELYISGNPPHDDESRGDGLAGLAASSYLSSLTHLRLFYCGLGPPTVRALAEASALAGLRSLSLGANQLDPYAIRKLSNAPFQTRLTDLDLSESELGMDGLRELLQWPCLRQLHHLDLSQNQLGFEEAHVLASSPLPRKIERLDLQDNPLDGNARELLRQQFGDRVSF